MSNPFQISALNQSTPKIKWGQYYPVQGGNVNPPSNTHEARYLQHENALEKGFYGARKPDIPWAASNDVSGGSLNVVI